MFAIRIIFWQPCQDKSHLRTSKDICDGFAFAINELTTLSCEHWVYGFQRISIWLLVANPCAFKRQGVYTPQGWPTIRAQPVNMLNPLHHNLLSTSLDFRNGCHIEIVNQFLARI